MIIPSYYQATSAVTFGPNMIGKWYCSYHAVDVDGERYARYMTPNGWVRAGCEWYDTFEQVKADFYKFGQAALLITDYERDARRQEDEYMKQSQEEDFQRYMEEEINRLIQIAN